MRIEKGRRGEERRVEWRWRKYKLGTRKGWEGKLWKERGKKGGEGRKKEGGK